MEWVVKNGTKQISLALAPCICISGAKICLEYTGLVDIAVHNRNKPHTYVSYWLCKFHLLFFDFEFMLSLCGFVLLYISHIFCTKLTWEMSNIQIDGS